MVWAYAEEGGWLYWTNDVKDEAARQYLDFDLWVQYVSHWIMLNIFCKEKIYLKRSLWNMSDSFCIDCYNYFIHSL